MKLIAALQRICSTRGLRSPPFQRERADRVKAMSASEEQRAEWLGSNFWDRLDRHLPAGALRTVRLWETDKNWAECRRDDGR